MTKNNFTEDQIELLQKNPYVIRISKTSISFSKEFKMLFWKEYINGKGPSEIFSNYGLDPSILGNKRRTNFVNRLKRTAKRKDDFMDNRAYNKKNK